MKNSTVVVLLAVTLVLVTGQAMAQTCNPIKSGLITDVNGNAIGLGYDKYGYNYQAGMFNGCYENYTRPTVPVTTCTLNLIMKWSGDWLSNKDCWNDTTHVAGNDGKLDRGNDGTGTSKGWLTNHFEGDYLGIDGDMHHYTEEIKMVYVGPAPLTGTDPWAASRIWGLYATIEDVINDAFGGYHGVQKSTLANPAGLGYYTN